MRVLRRAFIGTLALFVVGLSGVAGFTVWRLRVDAVANAFEISAMHARSFEDFLTQSLHVTELAAANALPLDRHRLPDLARVNEALVTSLRHAPFLRSISLLDDSGTISASSNPANIGVTVGLDNYLPPGAAQDTLRLGVPWAGRDIAGGRMTSPTQPAGPEDPTLIPVLRSLRVGDRSLTLLFALNPDHFINHMASKLPLEVGAVDVLRYDGVLLLATDPARLSGVRSAFVERDLRLAEVEAGQFRQVAESGRASLSAFRGSGLYPFVVVTALDEERALANWRAEAQALFSVVGVALLLVGGLATVFYRRQAALALQRAEAERLQQLNATVFGASVEAIVITDVHANIVSVNPAFSRITGYSAEEAMGRPVRTLGSGQRGEGYLDQVLLTAQEQGLWRGEMLNRRKDGALFDAHATISVVRDAQGQVQHFIGVLGDITERKRYEATLLAAKERAEQAAQAKSEFLATMSHEIRTPMNGIIGMTELALMESHSEEQRSYLQLAKSSANTLLTILSEILDYSKIEAGRLEIEQVPFNLPQFLQELGHLYRPQIEAKGLAFELDVDPALPSNVRSDPVRLRQVLSNLLSNALKFTQSGSVRLSCQRMTALPSAAASAFSATGEVLGVAFSVADTGIGVPPDRLFTIFEPFSQADNSTTRKYGGTGLGLTICRRLADLMGGHIGLESTPGQGSRFTLELPLQVLGTAAPASEVAGASQAAQSASTSTSTSTSIEGTVAGATTAPGAEPADRHDEVAPSADAALAAMAAMSTSPTSATSATSPISPASAVAVHETPNAVPAPLRVLVAEDVPMNQALMKALLGKRSYSVQIAENGALAVAAFEADRFDLILMDMQMPEVDGIEATRRIRAIEAQRQAALNPTGATDPTATGPARTRVPIVALTANAYEADREACLDAGMDDFLSKPVNITKLYALIDALFAPTPS